MSQKQYAEIRARMARAEARLGPAGRFDHAGGRHQDLRCVLTSGGPRTRPRVFGENRVQEAQGKWPALKAEFADIELI